MRPWVEVVPAGPLSLLESVFFFWVGGGSLELPEERKCSLIFTLTPSFQGKNIIFSVARGKQPSLEKGGPEGPQWFQTVQKLFCCLAPTLSSLGL